MDAPFDLVALIIYIVGGLWALVAFIRAREPWWAAIMVAVCWPTLLVLNLVLYAFRKAR